MKSNYDGSILTTTNYSAYTGIPYNILNAEITGVYGNDVLKELGRIIPLYDIYDNGAGFDSNQIDGGGVAANLRYKLVKSLINKEARFLFSETPSFVIEAVETPEGDAAKKALGKQISLLQGFVDSVFTKNRLDNKLLKAAKDCFIGKRVACILNFNDKGINLSFIPSLEFIFETETEDVDVLSKIVCFYTTKDSSNKMDQRIYKKKYWMDNNVCWVEESIYNGNGVVVEELVIAEKTLFNFIPAVVIVNDGLTGDILGESEIEQLGEYESWYSRLANADMDAERKSMNPIRYAMDCDTDSTSGLTTSAGSFWDLQTSQTKEGEGKVGLLESNMAYSTALKTTLDRIKNTMYEQIDMPNTSSEALQGVITSGKTLKAIYWGLIVRCNEKMKAWRPALEFITSTIIEGARLYPNSSKKYLAESLPQVEYTIKVENNYPLPEDEAEEKQTDLAEVTAQTMSKKSYMKKWRGLTDDEANAEIQQIAEEKQILEDSITPPVDLTV